MGHISEAWTNLAPPGANCINGSRDAVFRGHACFRLSHLLPLQRCQTVKRNRQLPQGLSLRNFLKGIDQVAAKSNEIRIDQLKAVNSYIELVSIKIAQLNKHRSPQPSWQCNSWKPGKTIVNASVNEK
jgi:hypothetical protein